MKEITKIASELKIDAKHVIPYGKYKAKIHMDAIPEGEKSGKLILVTGMTPTPAGEGKTTTSIGLVQALSKIGFNAIANLREPSLGPIFGIKGGGSGGGKATLKPEDEINIHFTGDAHAIASAHNLLSAIADNYVYQKSSSGFEPYNITWRRVTDMQDRALRNIVTGVGSSLNGPLRETGFDIIAASEIMAIMALSKDLEDLRLRLSRIVVGFSENGTPITAEDINATGPLMSVLRQAIHPNLVQTFEGQASFVHTGPFGNIAHGCSSIIADKLALGYSDYVITEAGFGADLGFEKFMHIKTRTSGIIPSAVVLVVTLRAIKYHGGIKLNDLKIPNHEAIAQGISNVTHLASVINSFNLPVVIAINKHPSDTIEEVNQVKSILKDAPIIDTVESSVYADGGLGGIELANAVVEASNQAPAKCDYLYSLEDSIEDKVSAIASTVYGASSVNWSRVASRKREQFTKLGWDKMPVCMAKTHLSISDKATRKGAPKNYAFQISDLRASVGAGFIYPTAGSIMTMPGLPKEPRQLDVDSKGNLLGFV